MRYALYDLNTEPIIIRQHNDAMRWGMRNEEKALCQTFGRSEIVKYFL